MAGLDDLLKDFLAESAENLAQLDNDVVELERDPSNAALLNSIFRTIHTIKGTCGFLGLARLESVSHNAESVLDLLRDGSLAVQPDVISDILRGVDVVKAILAGLESEGAEPEGDDSALLASLAAWLDREGAATTSTAEPTPEIVIPEYAPAPAVASLRVGVDLLDSLMNLAGELVLTRNQLLDISAADDESPYARSVQQLSRITAELQNAVMKTRMQPVGSAWGKLPRIVRDVARETGKKIELDMKGADTALDRQLVQALQDPLTHMLRNSADHGIETPAMRRAAGKPDVGSIRLSAFHESGHVVIEITDDGAGIDAARVRARAIERGLLRAEASDSMSDDRVLRFVFEPGFSTAESVTHISGRGVGMDVVRSNIEKVGGTVELHSVRGAGCTIRVRLPLTLAIIPALLVTASGESFAIPQTSVVELVRVPIGAQSAFDELHGVKLFRLRDALLPVLSLPSLLGLADTTASAVTLVVCQVGASRFGLVVDDVVDTQEIVVKPVGRKVRKSGCYAGCTILGDGRVIMIVDAAGIASLGGVRAVESQVVTSVAQSAPAAEKGSLLLFDAGSDALGAVPLARVARLEEIDANRIEVADGRHVVQYRGKLIPLIPASASVSLSGGSTRSVIVFSEGSTSFGLAVNEIRDIVEEVIDIEIAASRPGVLGTAVIAGAATEVFDVSWYVAQTRAALPS